MSIHTLLCRMRNMTKKNEKRLCWNCDGSVSHHLTLCPYCGVDLTQKPDNGSPFKSFVSAKSPFEMAVSEEEWKKALEEEKEVPPKEKQEESQKETKQEMTALLLLLPGIVFLLFGLALILFSHDGVISLRWNQNVAYFYLIGALPLLYLGWRTFR